MDDRHTELTGQVLAGRYQLVRLVGSGGMGAVYEAVQVDLGRRVAIKVLHPALAEDDDALTRFRREAEAAAALSHPNVVAVTELGASPDGMAFLVMEMIEGRSLSALVRDRGALPPDRAVRIIGQVLSALDAAHGRGIVHRDLKPQNVMVRELLGTGDHVKLVDFGVAKLTESSGYTRLTRTGIALGTPAYMAPEQILTQAVDARSDLHAVGAVLYFALTGQRPFQGRSDAELWAKIVREPAPRLPVPGPADVIARALAKDPDARFQTAREMLLALGPWLGEGAAPTPSTVVLPASAAPPPISGSTAPPPMSVSGPSAPFVAPAPSGVLGPLPSTPPAASTQPAAEPPRRGIALAIRLLLVGVIAAAAAAATVVVVLQLTERGAPVEAVRDATVGPSPFAVDAATVTPVEPVPVMSPVTAPTTDLPRIGTMHVYRDDAIDKARQRDPAARLTTIMCRGLMHSGENGPFHQAGWTFLFYNAETSSELAVSYWIGASEYPMIASRPASEPTPALTTDPDDLPDSPAVFAAFRRADGCPELPEDYLSSMTYHHDPADGDRACVSSGYTALFCSNLDESGALEPSPRCF